jgi:hypothetical protein
MPDTCPPFPQFGIYRPLTAEAAAEAVWFADLIHHPVGDYLAAQNIPADPEVRIDMGSTLASRAMVADKAEALAQAGFDFGLFCVYAAGVGRQLVVSGKPIPVAGVHVGRRGVGVTFKQGTPEFAVLDRQARALRYVAQITGGAALRIRVPGHVSILKWGGPHRHNEQDTRLTITQREELRTIIEDSRQQCGLDALALGNMVLGMGYYQPITVSAVMWQ